MRPTSAALRRECRIALSERAQPVWFRITKWIVFPAVAVALYHTGWFWPWTVGVPTLGLVVHFFYRWKTCAWTRPWGGWDDLEAGRG